MKGESTPRPCNGFRGLSRDVGLGRDLVYGAATVLTAPAWVPWVLAKRGYRGGWRQRFGRVPISPPARGARALVHAVSVGEVSSVAGLVPALRDRGFDCVVSSTTDTGTKRAEELFGGMSPIVRFPFDWTRAVGRFLDNVRPDVVVLVELELWPNFIEACGRRGIPVVVVGGRISDASAPRYRRLRPFLGGSFSELSAVGAQTQAYADRFVAMGTPPDRVTVTDSLKWDAVRLDNLEAGAEAFARSMGIDRDRPLVVAGSTGPGEEIGLASNWPADVQLLVAPRKPERFDAVARSLPTAVRRSGRGTDAFSSAEATNLFLLDSIGELALAYALADVAIVGRSFNGMGGSNPIEPAALGCATLMGPHHLNFLDTVNALEAGGGLRICSVDSVVEVAAELARDPGASQEMVRHAHEVIQGAQGATDRSVRLIERVLAGPDEDEEVP